ncbi:MAG: hypothetical protein K2K05_03840, partial [Muribaculaceae bacterium]|nr:hypothetical protein [Muribaculaceae bacterium]
MNKTRVTYLALGALFSAISCTTEMAEPDVCEWSDGNIYFRTFLNDVATSRAADMTLDRLESFQVTCFNTGDLKKDAEGNILPYFEEATFVRQNSPVGIAYVSSPAEGPRYWPEKSGLLKFFAFSPSRTVMASGNPDLTDTDKSKYFHLINNSTEANSTVAVGYSLGPVRINPDISRQFDFMTAVVSGDRWKDFGGGVNLDFRHQ